MSFTFPRMLVWLLLTIVLMGLALLLQAVAPGNLVAVTLYKAHLLSLGGWGGYWLDRALFPYDRPHDYLQGEGAAIDDGGPYNEPHQQTAVLVSAGTFGSAMLRRAIIVAACLITVGLGA
jgi:hypothetical protein